jgi:phosphohistidine phosphatase SixA
MTQALYAHMNNKRKKKNFQHTKYNKDSESNLAILKKKRRRNGTVGIVQVVEHQLA